MLNELERLKFLIRIGDGLEREGVAFLYIFQRSPLLVYPLKVSKFNN